MNVYRVFEAATVDTVILQASRIKAGERKTIVRSLSSEDGLEPGRLESVFANRNWKHESEQALGSTGGDVTVSFSNAITVKHAACLGDFFTFKFGIKIYELGKGTPAQTEDQIRKRIYTADRKIDSSYSELIGAGNVKRYCIAGNKGWIKYGEHLAAPRSPDLFSGPRLLLRRIVGARLDAAFVEEWLPSNTDVIIMKPKNEKKPNCFFFMGLICSKICAHLAKSGNVNLDRQAFPKINTNTLETLPVPPFFGSDENAVTLLVRRIFAAKKADPDADAVGENAGGRKPVRGGKKSEDAEAKASGDASKKRAPRKRKANLPPSLPGWD